MVKQIFDESIWGKMALKAWNPPPKMLPSTWAEKNRRLIGVARPGPYKNSNAPYLRGMMNILIVWGVIQGNIMKAAQIGVSELLRNLIGFWGQYEPDPVALTLPSQQAGRKIVQKNVLPLFTQTKSLRRLLTGKARDAKLESVRLKNGFELDLLWAGSVNSTASNPYRRVLNDEVDKFDDWAGAEPDPIGRTQKRTRSYEDRALQVNVSTPTQKTGKIWNLFNDSSVKLYFWVPCPDCGEFQRLVFPRLKWKKYPAEDKKQLASKIEENSEKGSVWYQCEHCQYHISEKEKDWMMNQGVWSTAEDEVIDYWGEIHTDAEQVKRWPIGTRIGFQVSALYCLWVRWSFVAAEFLRAEHSLTKAFNFRTETLGEPFEYTHTRFAKTLFSDKCKRAKLAQGIIPKWAYYLIATIDTQKDHFYYVLRAWGAGWKSQRIWHGIVGTFDELDKLLFNTSWPNEYHKFSDMTPQMAWIDSGGTEDKALGISRTKQVYDWVLPRQALVRAIKGSPKPIDQYIKAMRDPMETTKKTKRSKAPEGLQGLLVDSTRAQDLLSMYIGQGEPEEDGRSDPEKKPEVWFLNKNNDEEYNSQLSALHKTAEKKGSQMIQKWRPVQTGRRYDYRMCEVYQVLAAIKLKVDTLPPESTILEMRKEESESSKNIEQNAIERRIEKWSPTPLPTR